MWHPAYMHSFPYTYIRTCRGSRHNMGWLRLVGSFKLQVSFAKEPHKRDDILQKRPMFLKRLLIVAIPKRNHRRHMHLKPDEYERSCTSIRTHIWTQLYIDVCVCITYVRQRKWERERARVELSCTRERERERARARAHERVEISCT